MAFGDVRGSQVSSSTASVTSAGLNVTVSPSIAVAEADLIYVVLAQIAALSFTGVTDTYGNTYAAAAAARDAGNLAAGAFYAIAVANATMTTIHFNSTASGNDWACVVGVIEGPFSAIDANPVNAINDVATPYLCPASAALAQLDEVVMSWMASDLALTTLVPASPSVVVDGTLSTMPAAILASRVVASQSSITPSFTTTSGTPGFSVLGTTSFMKDPRQPYVKRTGGIRHAQRIRRGGGVTMWREDSGLLVPRWV
jgi:hypothetical protein